MSSRELADVGPLQLHLPDGALPPSDSGIEHKEFSVYFYGIIVQI